MLGCYTLKVVTSFAAAHWLRDYPGNCSRLHGHNWKVETEVETRSLDELGMGLDFKCIRRETQAVIEELDHRCLNDIPPFDKVNPTAENIAAHIYRALAQRLNDGRVRLAAVTLWETEQACVRYTEETNP